MTIPLTGASPAGHDAEHGHSSGALANCRMLIVAPDDYPSFRVDLVELFSRHLVDRGLRIDWSLRPKAATDARTERRGAETFHVPRRRTSGAFASLAYAASENWLRFKLAWRAARGDYDLIQVRDHPLWGVAYVVAARIAGRPFIFWMSYPVLEARMYIAVHDLVPMRWSSRLLRMAYSLVGRALFYGFVLPLADHVVVQSERMRERVAAHGIARSKMTPIPMGVSTERYNPGTVAEAIDARLTGKKSMAYMCADISSSTTLLAFDTLAALVDRGYDAVLIVIGAVPAFEQERLNARLQRLGVTDRVIYTGRLPLPEALGWVKRADVCLSPFEMNAVQQVATPTKLVEYLAIGRPVVATVHYDQSEVIRQSGGGIVTAFSGEAMAEGVARLFDDPEQAEAMGARGPLWVKANRDYAHLADLVEAVYADLLNGQRPAACLTEDRVRLQD